MLLKTLLTIVTLSLTIGSSFSEMKCLEANGRFPKPGSQCKSYYLCSCWIANEMSCPTRMNFHPLFKRCVWEDEFPCFEDRPAKECPSPNGMFMKRGSQCKEFYECIAGKSYKRSCPPGQIFNSLSSLCERPGSFKCKDDGDELETTKTEISLTANIKSTTSLSTSTMKILSTTSLVKTSTALPSTSSSQISSNTAETVISTSSNKISSLIFPGITTEKYSSKEPSITSGDYLSSSITTSTPPDVSTVPKSETLSSVKPTPTPRGCEFGDPNCQPDKILCPKQFGLFPHPDSPNLFIHCDHWKPYIKRCPEDLHFNPKTKTCEWQDKIDY